MATSSKSLVLAQNLIKLSQMSGKGVKQIPVSPVKRVCVIPGGFPYEAFNGRAMLHPRGMMMMFERARLTSWFDEYSPFMKMLHLDTLIYMVTASLRVNQSVYNISLNKEPITVEQELAYLGNTSFKLKTGIIFESNSKPLIEGEQMIVLVNEETKRPAPPPAWWVDELKDLVNKSGKPYKFLSSALPEKYEEVKICVNPSDVDFYLHAGSANYVKFATDAYTTWHVRNFGFDGKGDAFRNVKSMMQSFKGEVALGDVLAIRFWPDGANKDLFHFHLVKDSRIVHECDLEFFPLETNYAKSSL